MFETQNKERLSKYSSYETIIITGGDWHKFACPHFVHTMEYFYFAADIILKDTSCFYILIEPPTDYKSHYVISFITKLYSKVGNFIFTDKIYKNNHKKHIFDHDKLLIDDDYIFDNKPLKGGLYLNWFPNKNSKILRDIFIKTEKRKEISIGLINRQNTRRLLNYNEICNAIYDLLGIEVDVTYFEDKSFDYQINFFYNHDIIITPHGAQLCSIPFLSDDSLIIECCHTEWHPYAFFSGLSYTSEKYHIVLCDDHTCFPRRNNGKSLGSNPAISETTIGQQKLDITTDTNKIIKFIEIYLSNNNKLHTKNCYLE